MSRLIAQDLADDPRVVEAKRLIREVLAERQGQITGVRPADPDLSADVELTLQRFGQQRGGGLYYPYIGSGMGHGALVELADGSVKYDMIGGIGVHVCGHSYLGLIDAGLDAALGDTVMQGNLQQNLESTTLVDRLLELANAQGACLEHCFLTTSGAMANENALKLVFQKHRPSSRLLAFEGCFMGRTTTLAQVTDKPAYRKGLPVTIGVDYVPFYDAERPDESVRDAVTTLKRHLDRYPGQHAAMCFELILGEGGFYPGARSFFCALMDVLKEHTIAIVVDEVQTFGRTTAPFTFQHFNLDEYVDVVTIGKLTQVCATLFSPAYRPSPGLVSQTFTGSTGSILAAHVVLNELLDGGYFGTNGKIVQLHERFVGRLRKIADRYPRYVSGPYGIGGMIAFTAYDGSGEKATRLVRALYDNGVIAFVAGAHPTRVRFLLPVIALGTDLPSESSGGMVRRVGGAIDDVTEIIEKAIVEVAASF